MKELLKIQKELNAPKTLRNEFGKYNYRSTETILEALKPLLEETRTILKLSDELVLIWERYYIKATATLKNEEWKIIEESVGYAREEEIKKWMDGSQITWASSSYARKYALNWLFTIDDERDSDATNTHWKWETNKKEVKWYNDVEKNIDDWSDMINDWKTTPEQIIERIETQGFSLSKAKKQKILDLWNKNG